MQLDLRAAMGTPSSSATVPRLRSATQSSSLYAPTAPAWAERVRTDPLYSTLTVVLDVVSAAGAVALAQWWIPGAVQERNIALYSWAFVPLVIALLATRSMYRRKLNHSFLDDFEPVETSVAVATLATLTMMVLLVPPFNPGELVVPYVRPSDLLMRIWLLAAILMPAVRLLQVLGAALPEAEVPRCGTCAHRGIRSDRQSTHRPDEAGSRVRSAARGHPGRRPAPRG